MANRRSTRSRSKQNATKASPAADAAAPEPSSASQEASAIANVGLSAKALGKRPAEASVNYSNKRPAVEASESSSLESTKAVLM
jgi:hypothetical protein